MSHSSSQVEESEEQLVHIASEAISQCRWTVGECAFKWTRRYAKGRTDADFGELIGLSGDQVYQRRRVWESFSDVYHQFESLKWSHYYAALNWDDASECLQWAEESHSTVAEMKAWRRAIRGEDLMSEPEAQADRGPGDYLSPESAFVQDPSGYGAEGGARTRGGPRSDSEREADESQARLMGVARGLEEGQYAPFKQGATTVPPQEDGKGTAVVEPRATPEQLAKRLCSTLERCNKAMTPEYVQGFRKLPESLRKRLLDAAQELTETLAKI